MSEPRSRDAPLPLFIVAGILVVGGIATAIHGSSGRTIEGGRADGIPVLVVGIGAVIAGVCLAVMVLRAGRKRD
jgi:membrane protease YdiL (CAAX protease family)